MKYTFTTQQQKLVHQIDFRPGKNTKLGKHRRIVGTYHFSMDQVLSGELTEDKDNCLDCPLSYNAGNGKCYTHKSYQRMGLVRKLEWLKRNLKDIQDFDPDYWKSFVSLLGRSSVELTRFGVYGEPVLLPIEVVQDLANLSAPWTGYTHQWGPQYDQFKSFFMASTHSDMEAQLANDLGWRVFNTGQIDGVNCPASKEAGRKATCTSCALCGGTNGKGNKNIYIQMH